MQIKGLNEIPLTTLTGVGAVMQQRLHRLGIFNLEDLLFHFPRRYEDRTRITPLLDLQRNEYATIEGIVQSCEVIWARQRPILWVTLSDGVAKLGFRFFHFNAGMQNSFQIGIRVRGFGEVKPGRFMLEMHHPDYRIIQKEVPLTLPETLTPIYPVTEGLKQSALRKLTDQALALLQRLHIEELLPDSYNPHAFSLKQAILFLHNPPPNTSFELLEKGQHAAQKRVIFEELLAYHLALQKVRSKIQKNRATVLTLKTDLYSNFLAQLPFKPTQAQERVMREIQEDLAKPYPMMRLIQGDVGSGKTLVAALSAIIGLDNHQQVVLMAPTEILAQQHLRTFSAWFAPLGIEVGWLVGKLKGKAREQQLEKIKTGQVKMVIGTHALFQDQVEFHHLALVIIDEQHRFGVEQRLVLTGKGKRGQVLPHQLVMTATPIPRTLAMTTYADLAISIIDELPPGRTPVKTLTISEDRRNEVVERVHHICRVEKRQVYWVCTLIDESEVLESQAAQALMEDLCLALPQLRIGLVHGRMKPAEKQVVMDCFSQGQLDILVATTVIEVGVNVPNASVMIIENAERLGLSQLHQLRGRVGRGDIASFCILMYKPPLGKISRERLQVLRQSNDGFEIAEKDLEIRGPGEILGTKQTGIVEFKVANLMRDRHLLPTVQQYARQLILYEPQLADKLIQRWLKQREIYSNA